MLSVEVPMLDKVAVIAPEGVPVAVLGKLSVGLNDAVGAVPVPVSVELCGDPVALSAT